MCTIRRLPAGQELVQAAKDSLVVEATGLLQPQDAQKGREVVAAWPGWATATFGLSRGVILVSNG